MQKLGDFVVVMLIGIVVGASVGYSIFSATVKSERQQHELIVADWERRFNAVNSQLREALALNEERGRLDAERKQLDDEIQRAISESLGAISKARNEYERGLIQLRFARDIFEVLRRRYDLTYEGTKTPTN